MQSQSSSLSHEIVRAGAGAGKTTRLTQKVIAVATDHRQQTGRYPRMVLTTFTRKATQEIRERLMRLALEKEDNDLFDYVNSTSKLHISTIHGVLSAFLRSYGSRIGLNPRYEIISESQNQKIIKNLLRESLIVLPESQNLLETFTFGQLCDIANQFFALWSVKEPSPIVEEDFLLATRELSGSLAKKCDEVCAELSQIELEGSWVEWRERLKIIGERFKKMNFKEARQLNLDELTQLGSKPRISKKNPVPKETDELLKDLLEDLRELKKTIYDPQVWRLYTDIAQSLSTLLDHFSQSFQSTKIIDGELVMADMEFLSFRILKEAPEAAQSFATEWDYWFIDEYQDTSPAQVELLTALSKGAPSFVVGDPQQSIYLFRGARSEVFTEQEEKVAAFGGERSTLMKNYRSKPELLEFFNYYFTSYSSQFAPMDPREVPQQKESVLVAEILISEKVQSTQEDEEAHQSEIRAIVQKIQEHLETESEPSEIAVLARTNRHLELVAEYARELGIPYQLHSASGFYSRLEIKDALALLKFFLNPYDNGNFIRLLRSPWFLIGDEQIAGVTKLRGSGPYWSQFQVELTDHPTIQTIIKLRKRCNEVGVSETFREALMDQLIFEASDLYDPSGRRESNLWKLLNKLKTEEMAEGFSYMEFVNEVEGPGFLARFDDESDAVPVIEPNKVNLMTVHASKGLQFNHVIIGFMGQGPRSSGAGQFSSSEDTGKWSIALPDPETQSFTPPLVAEIWKKTLRERESLEQERVLYVAMTRAKQSVTLTWTEPSSSNSFARACPLNVSEGTHTQGPFSYRVRKEEWQGKPHRTQGSEVTQVRSAFEASLQEDKVQLSVTELTEKYQDVESASVSPKSDLKDHLSHFDAIEKGVRLHRLFELLKYTDEKHRVSLIQSHFPKDQVKAEKAVQYLLNLDEPDIKKLLSSGRAEWGFMCEIEGAWLQGQIDLWGRDSNGVLWLIDYKTGSSRYKSKAFDQLTLYCLGLESMGLRQENEEVRLAVLYPFEEQVFTQELNPRGEELETWRKRIGMYGF